MKKGSEKYSGRKAADNECKTDRSWPEFLRRQKQGSVKGLLAHTKRVIMKHVDMLRTLSGQNGSEG